ncbi:hypothetical protein BegalDRAFT_2375 [Beggiatoa alba B18LD]|uniref:Uncharacterized protein n=1 Tax=Beggiatoa alba B18LD TaxID=395493 RepID=I3CHY5_9GAMM|nr:hypothetical protein [Beggiatoa alba]EIJ43228.1 hypothetical protein BegalDRAFT_2375 [Beggiatoa alba B18LD]
MENMPLQSTETEVKPIATTTQQIDVKQAIAIARQQAKMMFPPESIHNLALEEVEFNEDNHEWFITLGYDSPHKIIKKDTFVYSVIEETVKREYKIFRISSDGKFLSMRIRNV